MNQGQLLGKSLLMTALFLGTTGLAAEAMDPESIFNMSLHELLNIKVVSATHQSTEVSQAPATIRVISRQQIESRQYRTLDDLLKDVPGIDLVNVQGAFPVVHAFRGSYGDENRRLLLMIDGVVENPINGSFELAGPAYNLSHVERVEIVWGPASALYGANAFAGFINLISRSEGDSSRIALGHGSNHSTYADLAWFKQSGNWHLGLSAYQVSSDGESYPNRHPDFSDAYIDQAYNLVGRVHYQEGDFSSKFGYSLFDTPAGDGTFGNSPTDYLGLPEPSPENQGAGGWLNFDLGGEPASLWHSQFLTAFWDNQWQINPHHKLLNRVIYRETQVVKDSYSLSQSGEVFFKFRGNTTNYRQGLELQHEWSGDFFSLISGVQYQADDAEKGYRANLVDPEITWVEGIPIRNWNGSLGQRESVDSDTTGIYSQWISNLSWLYDTELTFGVRYDDNSLYGHSFNPRLGLVNSLNEQWRFKLLYGTAFRAPTPFELFGKSPVRVDNPNLKPEKLASRELSLSYQQANQSIDLTWFSNAMTDVIVEGVPVSENLTQLQNIGRADIHGLELQYLWVTEKNFNLTFNYTYQQASQNNGFGEFCVPNVAEHKANLLIDWQLSDWLLHFSHNWVGSRETVATNPLGKADRYHVDNLALTSPSWLAQKLSLQLRMDNLFDQEYVHPGIRDGAGIQFGTQHEQPGRSYWLAFSLQL